MKGGGFIKVPRAFQESELYRDSSFVRFWLHCLYETRFKPGWVTINQRAVWVEMNAFLYGRKTWEKNTGLSEQQLRTCMSKAKNQGLLRLNKKKSTNLYSYYEITRYGLTWINQPPNSAAENRHEAEGRTSELESVRAQDQPPKQENNQRSQVYGNHQIPVDDPNKATAHAPQNQPPFLSPNRALKNVQKKNTPPIAPQEEGGGGSLIESRFEEFWSAFPRKKAKVAARMEFEKLNPSRELLETMLKAIDHQKLMRKWRVEGMQYVPHPDRWLRERRWEDDVELAEIADCYTWDQVEAIVGGGGITTDDFVDIPLGSGTGYVFKGEYQRLVHLGLVKPSE